MPYRSGRQRAFLHAERPGVAAKWDRKYGGGVRSKPAKKRKRMR